MASLFSDSYDYYGVLGDKWTSQNLASIDLSGLHSYTGIGCMVTSPTGPRIALTSPQTELYAGMWVWVNGLTGLGKFITYRNAGDIICACVLNPDGSFSIITNGGATIATSGAGLVSAQTYFNLQMSCVIAAGHFTATIKINNQTVVTGVAGAFAGTVTNMSVDGPGGGVTGYVDDTWICNGTTTAAANPNNTFLGPLRFYPGAPISDSTPLQWTPSSGVTHFNLVDTVPATTGAGSVSSATVGQRDQYIHSASAVPVGASIVMGQHCLYLQLQGGGSRSVGSSIAGNTSGSYALSGTAHQGLFPYDVNPNTAVAFAVADFPTLGIGPVVTA